MILLIGLDGVGEYGGGYVGCTHVLFGEERFWYFYFAVLVVEPGFRVVLDQEVQRSV